MIAKNLSLLLVALRAGASGQLLARRVPVVLDERSVRPSGGWALLPETENVCPNDLDICFGGTCCPTTLSCVESGAAVSLCCSGTTSCQQAYQANPYCADDTWSLWDESQGGINNEGYFCCAPNLVGLLGRTCVGNDTISSPTQLALELQPGGLPLSTSTVVASTAVSTSISVTTAQTTTLTPTSTSVSTSTSSVLAISSSSLSSSNNTTTKTSTTGSDISKTTNTALSSGAVSATSSSPSQSATKASNGNKYESFGSLWLVQVAALALFIGAAI